MTSFLRQLFFPKKSSSIFWNGALFGIRLFIHFLAFLAGYFYETGIHPLLMGLAFMILSVPGFILVRALAILAHQVLGKVTSLIFATFLATIILTDFLRSNGFSWPQSIFYESLSITLIAQILVFGSAYSILKTKSASRGLMFLLIVVGMGINVAGLYWVLSPGNTQAGPEFEQQEVEHLELANPGQPGEYEFEYFTYGSGTDLRRKEYGSGVRIQTLPVDASLILPEWKGSKARWREMYWDFGVKEFPVNGRVWLPAGPGPFPIILIVHGNHGMEDFSDPGYMYLGELLASRGFIAVSIDENFINATWSGDFRGREMPCRAWLLLKHLEVWRQWNNDSKNELFGKINLNKIILAGHSRGGEAVAIASVFNHLKYFPDNANLKFDFNFNIRGIIAIAPTDKRYLRRLRLENINYLSIQGSFDSDEASFFGLRQARRIQFSDSGFWFKSGLYVHRANHGQFNTAWGKRDSGLPRGWLLDINSMLKADEQMQIAKVYIAAFAEIVLNDNKNYLPMMRNSKFVSKWLPETIYLNNYWDSDFSLVEDFEDDVDLTTSNSGTITASNLAVWREEILLFRDDDQQGNNALILGWKSDSLDRPKYFEIELDKVLSHSELRKFALNAGMGNPGDLKTPAGENKNNGESETNEKELTFTIQLIDTLGNTLSTRFDKNRKLTPRLNIKYMKLKSLGENLGNEWEPSLEYFEYPINEFDGNLENFGGIKKIRFKFDNSQDGIIILDDIGFYPN